MKKREYRHIALILASYLTAFGKSRIRLSDTVFRRISGRIRVQAALISNVRDWLEDYGVAIFELPRGGYALVSISALEGAPTAKINDVLPNWASLSLEELEAMVETDEDEPED